MIDTSKINTYRIDLYKLLTAKEIRQAMKSAGIKRYVYEFIHKTETMKYGIQYEWDPTTWGERIYRQAWHIPGWPSVPKSSSGSDMGDIIQFFPSINKNDVSIRIWDMTNYPSSYISDKAFEIKALERQFIREYEDKHKRRPIGNIKDEKHMDRKTAVKTDLFDTFFYGG